MGGRYEVTKELTYDRSFYFNLMGTGSYGGGSISTPVTVDSVDRLTSSVPHDLFNPKKITPSVPSPTTDPSNVNQRPLSFGLNVHRIRFFNKERVLYLITGSSDDRV